MRVEVPAPAAPPFGLVPLIETVQRNCNIADARHARDMTLCNYLLGMREFYRWEQDIPLGASLAQGALGGWIAAREVLWGRLEGHDFGALAVAAARTDPFDIGSANRELACHGVVYGAGLGLAGAPHFFLAELLRREERSGLTVFVSGREYARNMVAPPASRRDGVVFLRQDALRRWLWEKTEIWGVRRADNALRAALDCHAFGTDPGAALEAMVERETETVVLHEVGEALAEPLLGPAWRTMLGGLSSRRAELLARAVRDHLADCLSTLPGLMDRDAACSIHLYFAHFEGMRRSLFPRLAHAYADWQASGNPAALRDAVAAGRVHWKACALALLESCGEDAAAAEREMDARAADHGALAL